MTSTPSDGYAVDPTRARDFRDRILRGVEPAVVAFVSGGFATRPNLGWGHGRIVVTNGDHVSVACTRADTAKALLRGLQGLEFTVRTAPCSIGHGIAVLDEGTQRQERALVWLTSKVAEWLDDSARESFIVRQRISEVTRGHRGQ